VNLDPQEAALWALIAICLVLIGALLTPGQVGVNERGAILAAIATVLFAIAWRKRRSRRDDDE
jgi:uncharacterized membrane protein YiaA